MTRSCCVSVEPGVTSVFDMASICSFCVWSGKGKEREGGSTRQLCILAAPKRETESNSLSALLLGN
jgi:hypothetical protein